MECAVVSNNYFDLLVEYRDLPALAGGKKPQQPKKIPKRRVELQSTKIQALKMKMKTKKMMKMKMLMMLMITTKNLIITVIKKFLFFFYFNINIIISIT